MCVPGLNVTFGPGKFLRPPVWFGHLWLSDMDRCSTNIARRSVSGDGVLVDALPDLRARWFLARRAR